MSNKNEPKFRSAKAMINSEVALLRWFEQLMIERDEQIAKEIGIIIDSLINSTSNTSGNYVIQTTIKQLRKISERLKEP